MSTCYTALREYFPANEMKSKEHFDKLLSDKGAYYKIKEGPDYALVYFEKEDFVFVDFMLVHSGDRSKGIGNKVINWLKQKNKPIILEVEPISAADPDTGKRVRFYKKSGFRIMDNLHYTRIHPVTRELTEMNIFYWSPTVKSEHWAIDTMATVYREVHSYSSEDLYGVPPQAIEEILAINELVYSRAKCYSD